MTIFFAYGYDGLNMKLSPVRQIQKGFTLIELLVVIGILGILAAALVATIDPFEQLKKAQDTTTTNALTEYINAITRYYTTHTGYPWDTAANNGADCNGAAAPGGSLLNTNGMKACTTALIGDNELKTAFSTSGSLPFIAISYDLLTNQTTGCYNPKSKSQLHNSNTHYSISGADLGGAGGICETTAAKDTNPTSCYWCTR